MAGVELWSCLEVALRCREVVLGVPVPQNAWGRHLWHTSGRPLEMQEGSFSEEGMFLLSANQSTFSTASLLEINYSIVHSLGLYSGLFHPLLSTQVWTTRVWEACNALHLTQKLMNKCDLCTASSLTPSLVLCAMKLIKSSVLLSFSSYV